MRYPNLRYGNPQELRHYAQFIPLRELSKRLRRSERSVRDWLSGAKKIPWWVPEIIRLQHMEYAEVMRQMNMKPSRLILGIATDTVIEFRRPASTLDAGLHLKNQQPTLSTERPFENTNTPSAHSGTG